MKLNCIAIDDEPLALGLISSFIKDTPFLNLLGTYGSASTALSGLQQSDIHLIFLDIQMPGMNGIEIARSVHHAHQKIQPRVIFTTAYNQFAVESYQVDALDYLLKPFDYEDFLRSANKGLQFFKAQSLSTSRLLEKEALFIRSDYQKIKIPWDDIKYIQGLKDYVKIFLKSSEKTIVSLNTLKSLDEKLPSDRFMRVQRSYIVALDAITAIATNSLWLADLEITIGEQYKASLHHVFDKLK